MVLIFWWEVFALASCACVCFSCDSRPGDGPEKAMKPEDLLSRIKISGDWSAVGELRSYIGQELIDYIDGGAELYFAYDFKEAAVKQFQTSAGQTITVEVYQMDRSENAYGVYSFDTDGEHPHVGQEATYADGLLRFWKDRCFVRIFSSDVDGNLENALVDFGTEIARVIRDIGATPAILTVIPKDKLIPGSLHYFHKNVCLNNFYYLSDENILNLTEKTEAVTYEYETDAQILSIIIVQYPKNEDAQDAYVSFMNAYFPNATIIESEVKTGSEYIRKVEQEKHSGIKLRDRFLILVFEAETAASCRNMLEMQFMKLE